jgi:hypothetical protein
MPKTTPQYPFEARIWITESDGVVLIETWSYELEQMEGGKRSVAEWTHEYLGECYNDEDVRKVFNLPATGDWQVLMKGTIQGGYDSYSGEHDSYLQIDEFVTASIPAEYRDFRFFNADVKKEDE